MAEIPDGFDDAEVQPILRLMGLRHPGSRADAVCRQTEHQSQLRDHEPFVARRLKRRAPQFTNLKNSVSSAPPATESSLCTRGRMALAAPERNSAREASGFGETMAMITCATSLGISSATIGTLNVALSPPAAGRASMRWTWPSVLTTSSARLRPARFETEPASGRLRPTS